MPELSAEILLRPTRVGFLTPPNDLSAVRTIMRACCCLWGGVYNPIIPVFKRTPKEWRSERYSRKQLDVARGYATFFEPDVYVETKKGLLEEVGLGALRQKYAIRPQVITLKEFLVPENGRNWSEPAFGLNIRDALVHIYKEEQQFVPRDKRESILVESKQGAALTEAIFGVYPQSNDVNYIRASYSDVYRPKKLKPGIDAWRRVFLKGAETPLRVTGYGLETQRYWYHDLVIFVFDPTRAIDLIDLWNLRLEPKPVLPIPSDWFEALSGDVYKILKHEHRPVVGNSHGVMHNATIEFGRSISKVKADSLIRYLKPGLPNGALSVKYWRNPIWVDTRSDHYQRNERRQVSAKDRSVVLTVNEGKEIHTTFETLAPEFARRYGGRSHRWVNVLKVSNHSARGVGTVLPFNTFDRSWPRLGMGGEEIAVGSEGWVFPQQFAGIGQSVYFLDSREAIIGSLGRFGITAELSEPGHIARQMLEQLGGLRRVRLLADVETLKLLNKMAGGVRRRNNKDEVVEENFELRTAPLKDWKKLVAVREKRRHQPRQGLDEFTKSNVIRLGLETDCPHCSAKNWSSLTSVDYRVTCERCLKLYDFPQAGLREQNQNFTYRVVGPFSVPDYGRGSYSALLTLRFLNQFDAGLPEMTFSTAMDLSIAGKQCEVDFVVWRGDDRLGVDRRRSPQLIVGEAKSFGKGELITSRDIAKLKLVANKLPGAIIVISILRDHFTHAEKKLLEKFVKWGRRVNSHGEVMNPVLLLTSHELTMDFLLSSTWKELGGTHAQFSDYNHTHELVDVADATQQIYLNMPPFHEARRKYWEKRHARRRLKGKSG